MRLILSRTIVACLSIISLFGVSKASGQEVGFEANAPTQVVVGQPFRVEYTATKKPDNFEAPTFEGFDILAGPSVARGSSTSITNGNIVKSEYHTYTFVLMALSEGQKTIPGAKITIKEREYSTKAMAIDVIVESAEAVEGIGGQVNPEATVAEDDVLLLMSVDKRNVYLGEPILLSVKLLTRVQMAGEQFDKIPQFNGFWSQHLDTSGSSVNRETYNSKAYNSLVVSEYLLYPQQSGELTIDPFSINYVVNVVQPQRRPQSLIDEFFGGGSDIIQVKRTVVAKPITISVKTLPAGAPKSFDGAVGEFAISAEIPSQKISENSSTTYSVKLTGTGNLPLVKAPKLQLPSSFEQYNIKTTESLRNSRSGISGYRQYDYPIIARSVGEYDIEPIEFSYFNPRTEKYVTLNARSHKIEVLRDSTASATSGGLVSGVVRQDIDIFGKDIRFIKLGDAKLNQKNTFLIGSIAYYIIIAAILLLGAAAYLVIEKRMKLMSNQSVVRGKRANKVALSRLNAAEKHMKLGAHREFYEEMLKALWGYMEDRLNIPIGILKKEIIREELLKRGVDVGLVGRYVDLISESEYAQYSPDDSVKMNDVYKGAVGVISEIEAKIKRY